MSVCVVTATAVRESPHQFFWATTTNVRTVVVEVKSVKESVLSSRCRIAWHACFAAWQECITLELRGLVMNMRTIIAVGVILLVPIVLLCVWVWEGASMESDLAESLRSGAVHGMHRDLQAKQWSPEELATIEVLKVPVGAGRERAMVNAVQARGRVFVSAKLYEYQGSVRDNATDIVHIFGYRRSEPHHWTWVQFHPNSLQLQVQRRKQQLDEMKQRQSRQQQEVTVHGTRPLDR